MRVINAFFDRRERGGSVKIHHLDEKADALYLCLEDIAIAESEEVAPGIATAS